MNIINSKVDVNVDGIYRVGVALEVQGVGRFSKVFCRFHNGVEEIEDWILASKVKPQEEG